MATLNDSDADAFFRQGDDGTYSGGPGDSIPAGVVNVFDDLEEDTLPRFTSEQIERRDRYKRWVTGLVGALGISAMLAVGIRTVRTTDDDAPKATAPVTSPMHVAAAPVTTPPQEPAAPIAAPATPVEAKPVEAVPVEPPKVAAVEPVKAANPTAPSEVTPQRAKAANAARNTVRVPRSSPPTVTAARTTPMPSLVHSSPPTANFPD